MTRLTLFIDDGGVLSDNRVRGPQWQRLVGEFFAPVLGGSKEAWAEANREVITAILEPTAWRERLQAAPDFESFDRQYLIDWLAMMCKLVGVPRPPDEESLALGRRASAWITSQIRAAFPGAADAVRALHSRGYTLHTASGETSYDLDGYLKGMGVRECFDRLYGIDLVEAFKIEPLFYERIFEDAGVSPTEALVVDDNPDAVTWAAQAGARVVLVGDSGGRQPSVEPLRRIGSLAELPELIEELG